MSAAELGRMHERFTAYTWRFEGRDVYTVDGEQAPDPCPDGVIRFDYPAQDR